jgi:two-component system, cell cycle sensor histidine kinase and response regulator CckA
MPHQMSYEELERQVQTLKKEIVRLKQASIPSQQNSSLLRFLCEKAPAAYQSLNEVGEIIDVNPAWLALLGYTRDDVIGKSFGSFLHPLWVEHFAENFPRFKAAGEILGVEFEMAKRDGSYVTVLFDGIIERSPGGEFKRTHCLITNVTEQRAFQRALDQCEYYYRSLISVLQENIVVVDRDCRITDVNQTYLRTHGYTRGEVLGRRCYEVSHGNPDPCVQPGDSCSLQEVFQTGEPKVEIHEHLTREGTRIWISVLLSPLKDENGVVSQVLLATRDVSDLIKTRDLLRESEDRFRSTFEQAAVGICHADLQGNYLRVNQRLCDFLGYTRAELMKLSFQQLTHPNDLAANLEQRDRLLAGEISSYNLEKRYVRKDGQIVWGSLTASLLRDDSGQPKYFIAVVEDATARKQIEERLQKFERMVTVSNDFIGLLNSDCVYEAINDAYLQVSGKRPEDIVGHPVSEFFEQTIFEAQIKPRIDRCLAGEEVRFKAWYPLPDGRHVYLDTVYYPVFDNDHVVSEMVVISRDITEIKRLEDQLSQAQKMEAIGTLAGGIAHDFNNLLMGIQGRTSLMKADIDALHPWVEHLNGIEDCVRNATDLTRQLLGFARGGKYEVKPVNLNELIYQHNRMFGRTKREVAIHSKLGEGLWTAEVDAGQIKQVLLNLYVNAWQAMPGGGDLYIQTENVEIGSDYLQPFEIKPGRYVKTSVTDTGVGMDQATCKRIFEPFFTTKHMGRGTGLGLASVYGIIKNHGGFINVYSEQGKGTTFSFYLPASDRDALHESERVEEIVPGRGKILLVDDEELVLQVGQKMLETLGYEVLVAAGGQEAVRIFDEHHREIDAVILDMVMPGLGGGETFDQLKQIRGDVRVILSSGYSLNGTATEIMNRGCRGFIQKPFTLNQLSQTLEDVLQGTPWSPDS